MTKREIQPNTEYRIKGCSEYFKKKYGSSTPTILIEDEHKKVFGSWWGYMNGNPACLLYAIRSAQEDIPYDGPTDAVVYYGRVGALGELVHKSELEDL